MIIVVVVVVPNFFNSNFTIIKLHAVGYVSFASDPYVNLNVCQSILYKG